MPTMPLPASFPARVRGIVFLLFLAGLFPLGCGGEPALPPLAPVTGKVTVDGKALPAGNVVLHAITAPTTKAPLSAGQIDSGNYEIYTGGKSGAPLNKFKVVVTPATVPVEAGAANVKFDQKYSDQNKTPLSFEVIATPEAGRYDLKLTK